MWSYLEIELGTSRRTSRRTSRTEGRARTNWANPSSIPRFIREFNQRPRQRHRKRHPKANSRCFKVHHSYCNSFNFLIFWKGNRCHVFPSSIKRKFPAVVVQWRQRNVQKSLMHVQSCCFANLNLLLFCRFCCRRRRRRRHRRRRRRGCLSSLITVLLISMYYRVVPNQLNPLNLNIKIQILICYPHTFLIEVVGRICWSIN